MKAKPSQLFTFLLGFNLNCREMALDVRINHAKAGGNFLGCHKQTVSLDIAGTWSRVNLDSLSLPGSISSCLPAWRRGGKQTISHFTSVFLSCQLSVDERKQASSSAWPTWRGPVLRADFRGALQRVFKCFTTNKDLYLLRRRDNCLCRVSGLHMWWFVRKWQSQEVNLTV